jgi:hypothetical protein
VVVGDKDGHGRDDSLMLNDGEVTPAPLDDSLCTLQYEELSGMMATKIGALQSLAEVDRSAVLDEAWALGMRQQDAHSSPRRIVRARTRRH